MRLLVLAGVCVLLFSVNTEAAKKRKQNKNQSEFWELWESDGDTDAQGEGVDEGDKEFIIDDEDGSGVEEGGKPYIPYEDDEDFPSSGDYEPVETGDKVIKEDKPSGPTTDDEDEFEESGSGEGEDGMVVDEMDKDTVEKLEVTAKPKPLKPCERLRSTAFNVANYIPECDVFGEFKRMQCTVDLKTKTRSCWCVTSNNTIIPGTLMYQSEQPDCENGTNLKSCLFQLVLHGQKLVGITKPECDLNGDWKPVQCFGSQCWCVDKLGNRHPGTETDLPEKPICNAETTSKPKMTDAPVVKPKPGGGYVVDTTNKNVVVTVSDTGYENRKNDNDRLNNNGKYAPVEHQREPMFGQPGFLAAIIAGGVITLLLIVLLVMFIVYRMRKKDEGSYPLDEQKYQNYSYAKAPDKEFYA